MNEEEWLACTDPLRLLQHLQAEPNARKTLVDAGRWTYS